MCQKRERMSKGLWWIGLLLWTGFSHVFGLELSPQEQHYLAQKGPITLCVDPDWEPFEWLTEAGAYQGIGADLIGLVEQRLGVGFTLVPTRTWEETIAFSKEGKCDVLSFLNQTRERETWLVFTEPLFSDPNVLIGRIEQAYIEDISKVSASVALIRETSIYEWFSTSFPHLAIIPVESEAEAFRLVEERKADLTLRSMIVAAHTIKKQGLFNLKIVGQPKGFENHLRMGVRKDEPLLRDILNKAIATLTQEERQAVVNRHVNIVVEKVTQVTVGFWIFMGLCGVLGVIFLWNYLLQKKVAKAVAKNLTQHEALFHKNRQAELVGLVANISHQWRDSLSHISSLNLMLKTKLMLGTPVAKEELHAHVNNMEASIDFMAQTMRNFLDFYKTSKEESVFDAQESIKATLAIVDMNIKHAKVQVLLEVQAPLRLRGVRNVWMHVWLNCINNTLAAAKKQHTLGPVLRICIAKEEIVFEDNCGGFSPESLAQFSGTSLEGLGLKMSQEILTKYGWRMELSNANGGARVRISSL